MRPLEYALLALLLLAAASFLIAPARRSTLLTYAPHIALTVVLAHALLEGGRWSLFPAYIVGALMAIVAITRMGDRPPDDPTPLPDHRWRRWTGGVLAILVTVASGALAWLFPVFALPTPTGPHQVGTRWLILTDTTRLEDLTPEPDDRRTVVVRLWFPADSVAGNPDDYVERDVAYAIARQIGLPGIVLSHLPLVKSHAHQRARLSAAEPRFPLLLFSHGYGGGTESQNTVQMEELASHGYVVASIDHLYEAAAVVLRGGAVATARSSEAMRDTSSAGQRRALLLQLTAATDTSTLRAVGDTLHSLMAFLEPSMTRWTADTRFVLDRLTAMSTPGAGVDTLFAGRLRTDRVGIFGMSFGGATAATFCTIDPRCVAGINLDGMAFGEARTTAMRRPFLYAASEESAAMHRLWFERADAPAWTMTVRGSRHLDYSDASFISPLFVRLGIAGGIPPRRMHEIMNSVVRDFFAAHVRGAPPFPTDELQRRFPEATFAARAPASRLPDATSTSDAHLDSADATR